MRVFWSLDSQSNGSSQSSGKLRYAFFITRMMDFLSIQSKSSSFFVISSIFFSFALLSVSSTASLLPPVVIKLCRICVKRLKDPEYLCVFEVDRNVCNACAKYGNECSSVDCTSFRNIMFWHDRFSYLSPPRRRNCALSPLSPLLSLPTPPKPAKSGRRGARILGRKSMPTTGANGKAPR